MWPKYNKNSMYAERVHNNMFGCDDVYFSQSVNNFG